MRHAYPLVVFNRTDRNELLTGPYVAYSVVLLFWVGRLFSWWAAFKNWFRSPAPKTFREFLADMGEDLDRLTPERRDALYATYRRMVNPDAPDVWLSDRTPHRPACEHCQDGKVPGYCPHCQNPL